MRSPRILEIRRRVVEALTRLKEDLGVEVYLFGSYAKNTHTMYSDVDIVVVSEKFEGLDYVERVKMIRLKLPEDIGFDIIALTPKELEGRKEKAFYRDIMRYWVKIG